ncbi:pyridoxamine 5'-phosphate oxidase family protein [Sanguibacter sp. 25GB23B1]|uniref:pyridoxamine 5'-phosphate oxidase family protein n=1 Tax=unclassified Sanguibacter TaxID=2645534 RepID=UPI0032AEFDDF
MTAVFDSIDPDLARWIGAQHMFFVATAPTSPGGHVNVSPRGLDSFSVLGPLRVGWVDVTGSGIETIAHLQENGRVCLMFCSFDARPRIVRLHGRGRVVAPGTPEFDEVAALHPAHTGARAVVVVDVTRVSDACGWGVPIMDLVGERDVLETWATKKGDDGLAAYQALKNARSIDGLPGLPGASGAVEPVRAGAGDLVPPVG